MTQGTIEITSATREIASLMSASLSEKDQKRFLAAIRRMTPENLSRFVQNTEYMSKLELSRRQSAEGRVVVKTMNELNEMAQ